MKLVAEVVIVKSCCLFFIAGTDDRGFESSSSQPQAEPQRTIDLDGSAYAAVAVLPPLPQQQQNHESSVLADTIAVPPLSPLSKELLDMITAASVDLPPLQQINVSAVVATPAVEVSSPTLSIQSDAAA